VTTGQILRKEPDAFRDVVPQMLGFDPKLYFKKPKPVCILTNTLNKNFT
jgi:hypothetical protein